jgi:hypothetical protein
MLLIVSQVAIPVVAAILSQAPCLLWLEGAKGWHISWLLKHHHNEPSRVYIWHTGIRFLFHTQACPLPAHSKLGSFHLPGKTQHAVAQRIDFQEQSRYFFLGLTVKPIGLSLPGWRVRFFIRSC